MFEEKFAMGYTSIFTISRVQANCYGMNDSFMFDRECFMHLLVAQYTFSMYIEPT